MMIKPIQTYYKGYHFRSRLEARWAVFFDKFGVEWQYETEGYILNNGEWYLPDFYLPELNIYLEIKPEYILEHNTLEYIRVLRCSIHMKQGGFTLWGVFGNPWPNEYHVYTWRASPHGYEPELIVFADCRRCNGVSFLAIADWESGMKVDGWDDHFCGSGNLGHHTCGDHFLDPLASGERIVSAYRASRSARFEFGETPR